MRHALSLRRWLPAIAVMVTIFVLSSQSGLRISDDADIDGPLRTLAHFAIYATLAAALLYGLSRSTGPTLAGVLIAFAVTLLFAISDEIHQAFVPDRAAEIQDLVVDALGGAAGLAIGFVVLRRR
ncbi:MAG: VanZ family protein [Chloroflexota bacterium]